jgi:hypothetical protein
MGMDQFGNYLATFSQDTPSSPATGGNMLLSGSGSPEGVVAANAPMLYEDTDNGDVYAKTGTGDTGWVKLAGGGGGTTQVYFGTGDPNGVQTATRPAIFYSADGSLWQKTNSGSNNTGWLQVLST